MKYLEDLQKILNDPEKAIRLGAFNGDRHTDENAFAKWGKAEPGCT
ncbi:MAG: hypothetical protein RCG15_02310 [Candidatus Rickettsia vulgarisii]